MSERFSSVLRVSSSFRTMDFATVLICHLLALSTCICLVISENVNTSCIRKCCPENSILSSKNRSCVAVNEIRKLPHKNLCVVSGCRNNKVLIGFPENNYTVLENNSLSYNRKEGTVLFEEDDYCLDHQNNFENVVALLCVEAPKNDTVNYKALSVVGEKVNSSCLIKCCHHRSVFSDESHECSEVNESVKLPYKNICPVHRQNCSDKVALTLAESSFTIFENNSLLYNSFNQSVHFSNGDYCVERLSNSKNLVALVCVEPPKRKTLLDGEPKFSTSEKFDTDCITKCCSHGSVFSKTNKECVTVNKTVHLPFEHICYATQTCKEKEKLAADLPIEMTEIFHNFTLMYTFRNQSKSFSKDDYCLDYTKENMKKASAFVCVKRAHQVAERSKDTGMIISMPFLLATFIAYALLPDRNLHMKALMFYVINLMLSYLLLVIIQLTDSRFSQGVCTSIGYFCLLFFLVSFFWMNVICIDIWFTFSGLRGFTGSKKSAERKRFFMYSAYAWAVPILHVLIVYIIDTNSKENSWFSPGIGKGQCFLRRGYPELLYFYGPMAILITINIILFAVTAFKIRSIKKETSMLKKEDSKRHSYENDKQTFNLYLKLLFAMGVNWSMEIISWAVIWSGKAPDAIWYLTDFCNAIYGVFIFFIFVFKRSIWKLLKKRYYTFIGKPYLAHSMTMTNTTRVTSYSTANSSVAENPHGVHDTSTLTSEA